MAQWPTSDEPASLVTKKQMNNFVEKYKVQTGFESGIPGQKGNTITTELKRISSTQLLGTVFKSGSRHA